MVSTPAHCVVTGCSEVKNTLQDLWVSLAYNLLAQVESGPPILLSSGAGERRPLQHPVAEGGAAHQEVGEHSLAFLSIQHVFHVF